MNIFFKHFTYGLKYVHHTTGPLLWCDVCRYFFKNYFRVQLQANVVILSRAANVLYYYSNIIPPAGLTNILCLVIILKPIYIYIYKKFVKKYLSKREAIIYSSILCGLNGLFYFIFFF